MVVWTHISEDNFVRYYYTVRGHNTVEQNLMPDSWLILSPVAAPACGVHKNCKITFTPDGGAINVAKRGNKSESLPFWMTPSPRGRQTQNNNTAAERSAATLLKSIEIESILFKYDQI